MGKDKDRKNKKKGLSYGTKDHLTKDAFAPENVKVRISLMVQGDILAKFKAQALEDGIGYQVLMQMALSEFLKSRRITERLQAVENEVFKKKHA